MNDDVRHEERRLQKLFHRALLIALATPAAIPLACGSSQSTGTGTGAGAGTTGTTTPATSTSSSGTTTSGATSSSSGAASTGSSSSSGETTSSSSSSSSGETTSSTSSSGMIDPWADGGICAPYGYMPGMVDTCGNYVRLPCGLPSNVQPGANCYLTLADCHKFCPGSFFNCHATDVSCVDGGDGGMIVDDPQGGIDLDCSICAGGVGRVPAGLARARMSAAPSALGDYFAAAAHFEEASVHAFRRLGCELAAHRAPARLVRAARRARRDEVRHTRLSRRMARRFGGAPVPPRVEPLATRPLDAIALENAVEGCVRETFGALVAGFQAANAKDPAIARMMETIARDETRHAALSWAVARWASRRLGPEARARIGERCRDAVEALRREVDAPLDGALVTRAGLPDPAQRRALLGALEERLWDGLSQGGR